MKRFVVPVIFALTATLGIAFAQSSAYTPTGIGLQFNPNFYSGMVPTPNQWNIWFSNKIDANPSGCPISLGCTGANNAPQALANLGAVGLSGGTMTGKLTTLTPSAPSAGLNLPHGTAPSSPVNGDVWTTSAGLFARINGITATYLNVGAPLGAKLTFVAPDTSTASANLPPGTAPSAPVNGDIWTTSSGFFAQVNGTTVGPYIGLGVPLTQIMTFVTPSSGTASINLPQGTAPSAPSDGDAWATTAGLFMRINGVTWGPFFAGGNAQTVKLTTLAAGTGSAGFNLPHGTAPSSPADGDVWTTSAGGLFARINGSTVGPYVAASGFTATGKITTVASASGNAGFNLPAGSAPSSPTNGDIWTTTSGLFSRINGATQGPYVGESGWSSQSANLFYGSPNGSSGSPSFRALTAADVPTGSDVLLFGDGSDGTNNCTGSQTLTKDMYYSSLTIGASCALTTAGYRVYVSGTLTFSGGTIGWNGNNGGNGTTGAGGGTGGTASSALTTAYLGGSIAGTAGGAGPLNNQGQASATPATGGNNGGASSTGGSGGNGTGGGNTGGAGGGAAALTAVAQNQPNVPTGLYLSSSTGFSVILGGAPAPGGGGGGGSASTRGGGGGGGGTGGGTVFIAALTINRTSLTSQDIIARGGNGGTGGTGEANAGGGGGGSGGGGGNVIIMFRNVVGSSVANAIDVSGGNGGAGGSTSGTGLGGNGGAAGGGGRVAIYDLGAGTLTSSAVTSAVAGNANSGTTGGTQQTNSRLVNF